MVSGVKAVMLVGTCARLSSRLRALTITVWISPLFSAAGGCSCCCCACSGAAPHAAATSTMASAPQPGPAATVVVLIMSTPPGLIASAQKRVDDRGALRRVFPEWIVAEARKYLHLRSRQRLAQRLPHLLAHDRILLSPDEQRRRGELRQRALQIGVHQSLVEDREPHAQRNRRRIAPLAAQEVRVHRRRRGPPFDHEGRVGIDRLLELADLRRVGVGGP